MTHEQQLELSLFFIHLDVLLLAAQRMYLPAPTVVEMHFHLFTPEELGIEDEERAA